MRSLLVGLFMLNFVFAQTIELKWTFVHPMDSSVIDAGTHGSVQEKLIDLGKLPDPFYGLNEQYFQWIEKYQWEFSSEFEIRKELLAEEFIELVFPGIDTYSEVYINGVSLGFSENAFRPYTYEIKKYLKEGSNKVRVVFTPPVLYHKVRYQKESYHLPAPNDPDSIAIAPYTRKPQYQFGWDWALRMNTIGFLKPVRILGYTENRVISYSCDTDTISEGEAVMTFMLKLAHPSSSQLIWKSERFGDHTIQKGEVHAVRTVQIKDPKLWWPRGQGEQHLYEDHWELVSTETPVKNLDKGTIRFGIRKAELITEKDQWGTSYLIRFNGRPIFCKGADYIPQDVFPARVKDSDLRKMVQIMAESNFNMVRVWGGGYYPDEAFFAACDETGIMVWQDFMFACAMYPGDPDFLTNVGEELNYQIPRIASHPSLTVFNGNNEVEVAWHNWGFQVRYHIYGKDARYIEESYDRLFKQLIPSKVNEFSNAPYVHTSPLSNWGKDEFYNHGSQHYWGVWHGKDPLENFALKIGRFNAEYGFQSFPEYSTLSTFADRTQWALDSAVMKHHQKSYVGNGMILKHAKNLYGMPDDFESFVYFSQLTQAEAVGMAVTGHRLDAPRCMGTLYWQLNDCWPAPTWSSIDHYWNKKALHYRITEDYRDVTVLAARDIQGEVLYYLASDQPDTFMCQLSYEVYDLDGKKLAGGELTQLVKGNDNSRLCINCFDDQLRSKNCVIIFKWKDKQGRSFTRSFSRIKTSYSKADQKDVKLEIVSQDEEEMIVKISNRKYVRNFWLYAMTTGVQFDRNFIDLLPGEHLFTIKNSKNLTLKDLGMKWM